ncbi:MAG: spermidine/putrescine ABC transporter substrate-binding protein [Synechococcales bacterium]|nr:spermidine/putrescine ABC transporter substrate-binding protein [Synechococcales bacterium]
MKQNSRLQLGRSQRFTPTRRRFLQASAAALSGIALSNCRSELANIQPAEGGDDSTAASDAGTLHIYTWADYTTDGLLNLFTERTGYQVVVDIYESNEVMLARMQAGGGSAYSILYPSDYMVQQMIELGMLASLDQSQLQGLDALYSNWQSPVYDPQNKHSVPYSWGTTGLLYNKAILEPGPTDWGYLWDNIDLIANRLTLLDDVRETMGAVLRSLGYSYNSTNPEEIEAAYERLVELKPAIANFQSFGWEDQLLGGDLLVVMSYSTEAIAATLEDENLDYIVPSSGSSLWTDTMVIPKTAPNPEAAYAWLNFILDPEVSKQVVESLYVATPNKAAYELLPSELKENTDLFPSEEVLAKCEGLAPVGDATELYENYWTELVSS